MTSSIPLPPQVLLVNAPAVEHHVTRCWCRLTTLRACCCCRSLLVLDAGYYRTATRYTYFPFLPVPILRAYLHIVGLTWAFYAFLCVSYRVFVASSVVGVPPLRTQLHTVLPAHYILPLPALLGKSSALPCIARFAVLTQLPVPILVHLFLHTTTVSPFYFYPPVPTALFVADLCQTLTCHPHMVSPFHTHLLTHITTFLPILPTHIYHPLPHPTVPHPS